MKFFDTLNSRFAKYASERRAINQLQALSDRDLNDMGLSRSGIRSAVRNGLPQR